MNIHLTVTYFSTILSSSVVLVHVETPAAAMSKSVSISACFLALAFLAVSSADTKIGITFWGDVRSHIKAWEVSKRFSSKSLSYETAE